MAITSNAGSVPPQIPNVETGNSSLARAGIVRPTAYRSLLQKHFDSTWYQVTYRDDLNRLSRPGEKAIDFYLRVGAARGHDPHCGFSELLYRKLNRDIWKTINAGSAQSGFRHWLERGFFEGSRNDYDIREAEYVRRLYLKLDVNFLQNTYGERAGLYPTVIDYYIDRAGPDALSPSEEFSERAYQDTHDEVRKAIMSGSLLCGFLHYLEHGIEEGRETVSHKAFISQSITAETRIDERVKQQNLELSIHGVTRPVALELAEYIEFYSASVDIEIGPKSGSKGLLVLLPHFIPEILFGGYQALFDFLRSVAETLRVELRLMVINRDPPHVNEAGLLRMKRVHPDIFGMFKSVDLFDKEHRKVTMPENFRVISYSADLHRIAGRIAGRLGQKPIFFIQDYEPCFFPHGDLCSFCESAFSLPHVGIYNSQKLLDYFQTVATVLNEQASGYRSCVLETRLKLMSMSKAQFIRTASGRSRRRLVVYARPEGHAARNLLATTIVALRNAVRSGAFSHDDWEFYGIGSLTKTDPIPIGFYENLVMLPRMPKELYESFLLSADVGMSFISTPHPGIVHFQMAACGMLTLTNTSELRGADWLREANGNLIPVAETVESFAAGLRVALARVNDFEERHANAKRTTNNAFDLALKKSLAFMASLLDEARGNTRIGAS